MEATVLPPPCPVGRPPAAPTHAAARHLATSLHAGGFELANGQRVHIWPIRPEDEPAMARFHAGLSPESVYFRYFNSAALSHRIAHTRLQRVCSCQDGTQIALVTVCYAGRQDGDIVGVGRLSRSPDGLSAEFAFVVSDDFQGLGLGSELMRRLIVTAQTLGLRRLTGFILRGNRSMLGVCRKFGFQVHWDMELAALRAELELD